MIFINSKFFVKMSKKIVIFLQNNCCFLDLTARFAFTYFRRKMYQGLEKWSNWPNFLYKCNLGEQNLVAFFGYLVFWPFYGAGYVQNGLF